MARGSERRHRRSGSGRRRRQPREWVVGARRLAGDGSDRAPLFLAAVVELPSELLLASTAAPEDEVTRALAHTLARALDAPAVGPPRRPDCVRVESRDIARSIRPQLGPSTPLRVAPAPELDEVQAQCERFLEEHVEADEPNFGREVLAELAEAAGEFEQAAPWEVLLEDEALFAEAPSHGFDAGSLVVFGDERIRGLALCSDPSVLDRLPAVSPGQVSGVPPVDADAERAAVALVLIPPEQAEPWLRESAQRGLIPRTERGALVAVFAVTADAMPVDPREEDLYLAAAAARGLAALVDADLAGVRASPTAALRWEDPRFQPPLRLVFPYEARGVSDEETDLPGDPPPAPPAHTPPFRPRVPRNAPCPCGSGQKYKRCHLPVDERAHAAEAPVRTPELDEGRLARRLMRYARDRFDSEWTRALREMLDLPDREQLALPWLLYDAEFGGRSVAEHALSDRGFRLTAAERHWLEAQRHAWLSIHEVLSVRPGRGLRLLDHLADRAVDVLDVEVSRSASPGDFLLARVVPWEGGHVLAGGHPMAIGANPALLLLRRARGRLRRRGPVPPERLREPSFGAYLIRRWEDALAERWTGAPAIRNLDGDPILLTRDRFVFDPARKDEITRGLQAVAHLDSVDDEGEDASYVILAADGAAAGGEPAVLRAALRLRADHLEVETNSVRRAEETRALLEEALGDAIRHGGRVHEDPTSTAHRRTPASAPIADPPPEVRDALRKHQQVLNGRWLDEPLPALGGRTPRRAARTLDGRRDLGILLRQMERAMRSLGAETSLEAIRTELRLPPGEVTER